MKRRKPYMKTDPYDHQAKCLELSKDRRNFALLLEQGCGKSKIILDNAAYLFLKGKLDGLLIVAPNGVHTNWIKRDDPEDPGECLIHLSERTDYALFEYDNDKRDNVGYQDDWFKFMNHEGLAVMAVNVEALSQPAGKCKAYKDVQEFLKSRRCLLVVDESSRIKTPTSKRTKNLMKLGKFAAGKRILTGTPTTQTPFDLYSQFNFLDPKFLGFGSFFAFKHHFGVWVSETAQKKGKDGKSKTWTYETLQKYVRLEELAKLIAPNSFRVTKDECLDLPAKIYQTVRLSFSPAQAKLYRRMDEHGILEFDDIELLAPLQITKLLRLQQITGGFVPTDKIDELGLVQCERLPGPNPKLNYLVEAVRDEYHGKAIIWAKFRFEIKMIVEALREEFGSDSVVEFHGGVKGKARTKSVSTFQNSKGCRFLVGQQQSGIGVNLTAARTVFYFSNAFSYEQRYQSEDRSHRIGTKHKVTYVDLVARDSVDERVRGVLSKSRRIADIVTGDSRRKAKRDG